MCDKSKCIIPPEALKQNQTVVKKPVIEDQHGQVVLPLIKTNETKTVIPTKVPIILVPSTVAPPPKCEKHL